MESMTDQPSASDIGPPRAKILVVDDRQDKLLAFRSVLQDLTEDIFTASSGDDALRLVLEHEFAVILLDVNMPGMDGLETAALIRKRRKSAHTPIIFITAYSDEMLIMQAYSLGAVDYIMAPVMPEILRTKVKVFVDLFRLNAEAQKQMEERIALTREQTARAAAEEANWRSTILADASKALTGTLDLQSRIYELFPVLVPSLADMCSFVLLDEHDQIEHTEAAWKTAPGCLKTATLDKIPEWLQGVTESVIATRKPHPIGKSYHSAPRKVCFETISQEFAVLPPPDSGAAFPLIARGRMLGVLCFARNTPDHVFTKSEWHLLEDLSDRAAITLDNALLYKKLETADRNKSEFLALLGHELRNPLAPIRSAVELLNIASSDQASVSRAHAIIERQVANLTRLVDDLLDVSRITSGRLELQLSEVEVSDVIAMAVETSTPLIKGRKHRLIVSQTPKALRIKADPGRLAQVLENLLNNAAKYTPDGGVISLSVTQEENDVVFRVSDNGIGISGVMLSHIFDLFARIEQPNTSFRDGLGVGLYLARRVVELHGGSIAAFSAGHGKGSEFVVRVPIVLDEPSSTKAVSMLTFPAQLPTGMRILIVDDNEDIRETMGELLMGSGFEVQTAGDAATALEAVAEFDPQAVLLDIGIPVIDGYELARQLRALPRGDRLKIIAITGYGQEQDRQRSFDAGFDAHVTKPLGHSQLLELLGRLSPEVDGEKTLERHTITRTATTKDS
jgi:CheY-like chemotaxis protein